MFDWLKKLNQFPLLIPVFSDKHMNAGLNDSIQLSYFAVALYQIEFSFLFVRQYSTKISSNYI